jgi:hypothetical protein
MVIFRFFLPGGSEHREYSAKPTAIVRNLRDGVITQSDRLYAKLTDSRQLLEVSAAIREGQTEVK